MKRLSLSLKTMAISSIILAGSALAASTPMDEFYANPANQAAYKKAISEGHVVKGRLFFVKTCQDAKAKGQAATLNCECVKTQIAKVSDEEFFFETVQAFQEFQARAKLQGDAQKLNALKAKQAERVSLNQTLEQSCG